MSVPFVDLKAQHAEVASEVDAGLAEVFARTAFIGGPAVGRFEEAFAAYVGVRHCVGVGNGTDALELAYRAVGVRPGGEVIIPANTFIATAEAASRIGAIPVPVDVDPVHLLMDPEAVRAAVGPRTQAIVPVHLFGQVAPMAQIAAIAQAAGVPLVEDAAQAQGARQGGRAAGTFGVVAGTSFYPGKNLGAAGDGGGVLTDDADVARTVRVLSAHGSPRKYEHELIGVNSRLDTVQAVVLEAKLRRLDAWNAARRAAADRYAALLAEVPGVTVPTSAAGNEDIWHLYVVQVDDRDRVLAELGAAGIGVGIHYPTPVHLTQAYAGLGLARGAFPVTEAAADRILSLPMFPHLTADQQDQVVTALAAAVAGRTTSSPPHPVTR